MILHISTDYLCEISSACSSGVAVELEQQFQMVLLCCSKSMRMRPPHDTLTSDPGRIDTAIDEGVREQTRTLYPAPSARLGSLAIVHYLATSPSQIFSYLLSCRNEQGKGEGGAIVTHPLSSRERHKGTRCKVSPRCYSSNDLKRGRA